MFYSYVSTHGASYSKTWLAKKYSENLEFALQITISSALAFVTINDVITSYNTLIEINYFQENEAIMEGFFENFESTLLVKIVMRRRKKQPKTDGKTWNCFSRIHQDLIKDK